MQFFRRVPQRCRGCQNRFYTYLSRADDEDPTSSDHTTPAGQGEIH